MSANPSMIKPKNAAAPIAPSWRDELGLIARPARHFALALLVAACGIGASIWLLAGQNAVLAAAQNQRNVAVAQLSQVDTEKRELATYQARFQVLQRAGLIGDEHRLDWIEAIRFIQTERKLLPISYDIEPQQVVSTPLAMGEFELHGSRMHLHMELLHELDLFNFLADLKTRGLVTVQSCKIKRNEAPLESITTPRMLADCTLNWLTMGRPAAKGAH